MPVAKMPKKSPHVDMTPMVDLFSVVLIFLMLTTNFRVQEPTAVDTPYSISEKTKAEENIMTIVIGNDESVYFNMDNGADTSFAYKYHLLKEMGNRYEIEFTEEQLQTFRNFAGAVGIPMENMVAFLNAPGEEKAEYQVGVPMDSLNNQLGMWILYARQVNPNVRTIIKAGAEVPFPKVKEVLDLLQDYNVSNFSLVTNLETVVATLDDEE